MSAQSTNGLVELKSHIKEEQFTKQFGASPQDVANQEACSTLFVKKLLAVAVSNVCYLRMIVPEDNFNEKYIDNLKLKIMKAKGSKVATRIVESMKGCFDAVERQYLKSLTIWFFTDKQRPDIVEESYTFTFDYKEDIQLYVAKNEKQIKMKMSGQNIKEAVVKLLKNLILVCESLEPLPESAYLKMQLSYFDRVPGTYEPPGFSAATTRITKEKIHRIGLGHILTNHHRVSMELKTKMISNGEADDTISTTFGLDADASFNSPGASPVDCICGCGGGWDLLVTCQACGSKQHGICFGFFADTDIADHLCGKCGQPGPKNRPFLALFRRTLLLLSECDDASIPSSNLMQYLNCNVTDDFESVTAKMIESKILSAIEDLDAGATVFNINKALVSKQLQQAKVKLAMSRSAKRKSLEASKPSPSAGLGQSEQIDKALTPKRRRSEVLLK